VVRLYDRNQLAGEMRLRPVSVEISTGIDHGWQFEPPLQSISPSEPTVRFDGRSVTYGFGELDMLVPAYATTIHKSQGQNIPPSLFLSQECRVLS
jgi:hypothetical protein